TPYPIPYNSVPIESPNNVYSAPTFTVPVEGWYIMNFQIDMTNLDAAAGTIQVYAGGSILFMGSLFSGGSFLDGTNLSLSSSVLRFASSTQTTTANVVVAGIPKQVNLPADTNKFALVN